MDVQSLIVAAIVLAAIVYVARIVWRKTKAFSSKSGCAAECGCSSDVKQKI